MLRQGEMMGHIEGRITKTPTLRKNADGKSYCFFTVVVNTRPAPNKDGSVNELEALYYELTANGNIADDICKYAQKGMIFSGWVSIRPQKPREVTGKDGVIKVYHGMRMAVLSRPGCGWNIFNEVKKEDSAPAEPDPGRDAVGASVSAHAAAAPVQQQAAPTYATSAPANDFLDDFQVPDASDEDAALENEIISQLPY